ncbi:MAG: hypothetical protein II453_03050 [Alphaproteobacteria bacterium]|nr:hypothetical protein [Alphaproteobacteria bacterium]MBQ2396442.1 hypothetical protein [Bacteroidales bacterium]
MAIDVSAMGLKVLVQATLSFPLGIEVTHFADDGESLAITDMTTMETGMGVNGDLVVWRVATPCEVELNVIPGTDDCNDLEMLFNLNMTQKNRVSSKDLITMIVTHPNGKQTILTNGYIVGGKPAQDYSSNGRANSRTFRFIFENNVA